MEGYVKNVSKDWAYAMKRAVRPGGEIPLGELFDQYGKKYDMLPDEGFIEWLTNVKLKDRDNWKIVYDFKEKSKTKEPVIEPIKQEPKSSHTASYSTPMVTKKLQVEDVVNLSVRKAREEIPNIMDLNLLKYALKEAKQLSDKDSLCRILYKRVQELQMSR